MSTVDATGAQRTDGAERTAPATGGAAGRRTGPGGRPARAADASGGPGGSRGRASPSECEERLRAVTGQARTLAVVAACDERLVRVLTEDGGVAGVLGVVEELTGRSVVVADAAGHRVASAGPDDGAFGLLERAAADPELSVLLRGAAPGSCVRLPAVLRLGLHHRHLAAPVDVGDARWGWVAVAERPARLTVLDERVLRRAAAHLALELSVQRRAAVAALDARSTLARLLVRGTHDRSELARCATFLGVSLTAPRVVVYVTDDAGDCSTVDTDRLVAALGDDVLATKGPEGMALLVEVAADVPAREGVARVKARLAAASAALGTEAVRAGLSTVCADPHGLPAAYREARETARCTTRTPDAGGAARHRILAADDLGPARVFVAGGDTGALKRFVADVLGPLLDGDDQANDLLLTMATFFACDRQVRRSAVLLGIHENTVRYRFARVLALTGLDVAADAQDQLTAQTAILVLRLQDHPAVPPVGEPVDGPVAAVAVASAASPPG